LYHSSHKRKAEKIKEAKKWKEGRIVMNMIITHQENELGKKEILRREERTETQ
jgi:hypothetical protein